MDSSTTELERAFQLAKSGDCRTVDEIRKKLSSEGYYATQITGKGLLKQLQAIITAELTARSLARERGDAPARKGRPKINSAAEAIAKTRDGKRSPDSAIPVDRLNASNDG